VRRGPLLAALAVLAACGGSGDEQGASDKQQARAGNHVDPALEKRLPRDLDGVMLQTESYSGPTWLKVADQIGAQVDFGRWLERLGKKPEDLTAAWAKSDYVKVLAFRVEGVDADELMRSFVAVAAEDRWTAAKRTVADKQFTSLERPGDVRYQYVSGDTMYGLIPADDDELEALAAQLP
jgi:hypothetical protein